MERSTLFLAILFFYCSVTSCKEGPKYDEKDSYNSVVKVCELITPDDVGSIFKVKVNEYLNTMQTGNENGFVSQCTYYTGDNMQFIALMIRFSKNQKVPTNEEELAEAGSLGNKDEKKQMESALKNGKRITDLKGFAVWYQYYEDTPTLAVYFDNYEIVLNTYLFKYDDSTMNESKKLVSLLIEKLK